MIVVGESHFGWGNAIHRSLDGGKTWTRFSDDDFMRGAKTSTGEIQPWEGYDGVVHAYAGLSTLNIDRRGDGRRLWMTHWPGVWSCADLTADTLRWKAEVKGHEEVCLYEAISPTKGAPLLTGMMDVGGFRHPQLDAMPTDAIVGIKSEHNKAFHEGSDLDFCEANPDVIVAAGGYRWNDTGSAGFSTDNGRTWQNFPTMPYPGARNGRIAVSATNPDVVVWLPLGEKQPVWRTGDRGQTWTPGKGGPVGTVYEGHVFTYYQPLTADRVKADTFYAYDRRNGRVFRSEDGGQNWRHVAKLPSQPGQHFDQHQIVAAPGVAGEVWCAVDDRGLFRSSDGGTTWVKLDGVERAWRFGFGKGSAGNDRPVAYVLGRLKGDDAKDVALFRSGDLGATWQRIDNPRYGWGQATVVNGDRQTADRVYVGTNGRGIFYGDPR